MERYLDRDPAPAEPRPQGRRLSQWGRCGRDRSSGVSDCCGDLLRWFRKVGGTARLGAMFDVLAAKPPLDGALNGALGLFRIAW